MDKPIPAFPRSLFVFSVLYGGMVCIAGVLGVKQVALGPLAVEAGIFGFLLLVVLSSAIAELHGQKTATFLVRLGFIPLLVSAALIHLVLALPHDPGMYPPAVDAFPVVVGQSSRMMIAGLISYGISQTLNVLIFSKLSGQVGSGEGKLVWLRGMIASIISQIIDTILFITISFLGERPIVALMEGQMLTKVILSIVLVPFMITFFVKFGRRLDRA
ncbi:queuosine precursor transporter [Sphingomonas sp. CFBP 13728]|uniref:queuosine precursor transporter n=1 Tax=Sphingomonas sp. CFBP 13728 TaxID=2775294 RepID=UPI001782AEBC|nr:queuosine precursor transporter [Sphingomonas sp. CFBP 13728]MBD8619618.1 queuosine precursor transporter [Sphingomonas sp. CFBP 13728]